MSKLYDKLVELQNENKVRYELFYRDVFMQLVSIASDNELHPNELPQVFRIYNAMLYQNQMEALMKRMGLDVTVKHVGGLTRCAGNSYEITQKEKT